MPEKCSNQITLEIELSLLDPLLKSKDLNSLNDDLKNLVALVQTGNFQEVVELNYWIFGTEQTVVNENIEKFLKTSGSTETSLFQLFCIGVSSLQLFIQSNWLGLNEVKFLTEAKLDADSKKSLVLDGECIYPTIKNKELLLVAKTILYDLKDNLTQFKLSGWWMVRYIYVHQRILEESSQILYTSFLGVIGQIGNLEKSLAENLPYGSLLQLELGYTYLLYSEVQKAKFHFDKANEVVGFRCEWTGALGRRTRYQQTPLSQLTIRVHGTIHPSLADETRDLPEDLPRDVKLDDDTRLNQIAFIDQDDNIFPNLPPLHQALLIAHTTQLEKFHPKDELLEEELTPLLNCILGFPKVWSFHASCLLIRSKLESNQRRTIERSLTQIQELADCLAKTSACPQRRIEYFYVSRMPLECELHSLLANVLHSLGAVSSALDIYLRLQMWEGVIACYQHLERKHKAEEIVRQELAKEETPKLWCLLGDCTDNVEYYEKAWELSNHTSARAQRDWAYYFYTKKQFHDCIPHFQESLRVNSLQESVWIRLAFSAMEVENWEIAAGAYRRYCALNSESFEAWNNVAKCYTKLGQKARAWKALQEAVKCNFDNWKIWDNLMVVSIDCCEYEEAIRSYNRILDLKEKHIDVQVLRILVQAIVENKEDNYGQEVGKFAPVLQKLFGRLTSQVTNNAEIWEIYSDLVAATLDLDTNAFRVAQLMQKAHRSAIQEKNWEKDTSSCIFTLKLCSKFVKSCLAMLKKELSKENIQLASSAKLSARSAISTVKHCYPLDIPQEIKEALDDIQDFHKCLEDQLSSS